MNDFIKIRDAIRKFIFAYDDIMLKVRNALIGLVGMILINSNFGYQKTINHWFMPVIIGLLSAFLPMKGVACVLGLLLIVHLTSLSLQAALFALGFWVFGIIACTYFKSESTFSISLVPVTYGLSCPYVMASGTALLRDFKEIVSVICGTVVSFYLHILKINASTILDETADVSMISLLKVQMLQNKMFYFYVAAMVAMYITVYIIRHQAIKFAWIVATAAGAVAEFIIMLTGLIISSQRSDIGKLILGNIIVLLTGIVLHSIILDFDYSRVEKVQFEDDDYYYYVTAVPKIRMASEDKEIKTF